MLIVNRYELANRYLHFAGMAPSDASKSHTGLHAPEPCVSPIEIQVLTNRAKIFASTTACPSSYTSAERAQKELAAPYSSAFHP